MVYVVFESAAEKKKFGDCCCCFGGPCCKPKIMVASPTLKTTLNRHRRSVTLRRR